MVDCGHQCHSFVDSYVHTRTTRSQGRNHVFKVGVQFLGLGYCAEQNTDGIANFVHCSVQLRKKLGWSVQILGGPDPPNLPPVVAPLLLDISLRNQLADSRLPLGVISYMV